MSKFICSLCRCLREEHDKDYEICEGCFFNEIIDIKKLDDRHIVTFNDESIMTFYKIKCKICEKLFVPKQMLKDYDYDGGKICDSCKCR